MATTRAEIVYSAPADARRQSSAEVADEVTDQDEAGQHPPWWSYGCKHWARIITSLLIVPFGWFYLWIFGPEWFHCPQALFVGKFIGAPIALFVFFTWIFPAQIADTNPNDVKLYYNGFYHESGKFRKTYSGSLKSKAFYEVYAGSSFVFFWDIYYKTVSLTKQIVVKGDPNAPISLSDGTQIRFDYLCFATALPGSIANHVQYTDDEIKAWVNSRLFNFAKAFWGERTKADFTKEVQTEFKREFRMQFGGPTEIDSDERRKGTWTGDIKVTFIGELVESGLYITLMENIYKMVNKLTSINGLTADAALRAATQAVFAASGKSDVLLDFTSAVSGGRSAQNQGRRRN